MVKEWLYVTVSLWVQDAQEESDLETYIKVTLGLENSRK